LAGYGITDAYTKLETDAKAIEIAQAECARLVASAPETLNTLDEIAAALGDDPNFATTMTNQLGTKANKTEVYTKSETNNKVNTAVANKVTSTDVTQIKVVNEIPEVGS
jgi:phage-related tail fiber protein